MSSRQIAERKERSMIEVLVIVVLMGALAAVFISSFFKQEQQLSNAAFESLVQEFSSRIQVIHAQWMMDKQPNVVQLRILNSKEIERVTVNKKGWVDSSSRTSPCQDIWFMATGAPLIFMNSPVTVIDIERAGEAGRICKYLAGDEDQQYAFEYSPNNGKIKR
jgi:type II secretory pathway pseudopilin PulG